MKAAFHTLGCKTNAYETQAIKEQFEKGGFEIADFTERADVYIVNTCSVTAVAAQKSRQMLSRCRKKNPDALIVACGCYAQEDAGRLKDSEVDLIVGNNEKSRIFPLVMDQIQNKSNGQIHLEDLSRCRFFEEQTITDAGSHVRAYVKIQDGCDRFCSYCIIPYLRGRSRSRGRSEILEETKNLVKSGIQEIVLTGIDISDYREDSNDSASDALADLILQIEEIEGIERIRLGSLEAGIVSEDFIRKIEKSRKLCPHFHLSLQSGCDATLKRMNRHYTTEEFLETIRMLRGSFSDPAITTDVIAGFAGETEEEFEETRRFLQKAGFAQLHVFPYSRRKGTNADRMPGQLTKAVKAERTAVLIEDGRELQKQYLERHVGKPLELLTEDEVLIRGEKFLAGYTPEYIRAAVKKEGNNINRIVTIFPRSIYKNKNEIILI